MTAECGCAVVAQGSRSEPWLIDYCATHGAAVEALALVRAIGAWWDSGKVPLDPYTPLPDSHWSVVSRVRALLASLPREATEGRRDA